MSDIEEYGRLMKLYIQSTAKIIALEHEATREGISSTERMKFEALLDDAEQERALVDMQMKKYEQPEPNALIRWWKKLFHKE